MVAHLHGSARSFFLPSQVCAECGGLSGSLVSPPPQISALYLSSGRVCCRRTVRQRESLRSPGSGSACDTPGDRGHAWTQSCEFSSARPCPKEPPSLGASCPTALMSSVGSGSPESDGIPHTATQPVRTCDRQGTEDDPRFPFAKDTVVFFKPLNVYAMRTLGLAGGTGTKIAAVVISAACRGLLPARPAARPGPLLVSSGEKENLRGLISQLLWLPPPTYLRDFSDFAAYF